MVKAIVVHQSTSVCCKGHCYHQFTSVYASVYISKCLMPLFCISLHLYVFNAIVVQWSRSVFCLLCQYFTVVDICMVLISVVVFAVSHICILL